MSEAPADSQSEQPQAPESAPEPAPAENAEELAVDDGPVELIGVGSPLVDYLLHVEDAFLKKHVDGDKGGMVMVEADHIQDLIGKHENDPESAPGGAASNTTLGATHLGIRTAFIGAAGKDDLGSYYSKALADIGCEARLVEHDNLPTGHVLSLVTPDAERTMRTCLGAAGALDPSHFTAETFAGAKVVMLEGYTLFNHELTLAIAQAAKDAGAELALDMASFEVVQANRSVLETLLDGMVDLVFANEDEAKAWKDDLHDALADFAARCKVAVVKLGAEGAWIHSEADRHHVGAHAVDTVVDTTGAGDNWAAGFLAGYLRGLELDHCGHLGSQAGAAVVQKLGAQPSREDWAKIRGYLDAWV